MIGLRPRTLVAMSLALVFGVLAIGWPLLVAPSGALAGGPAGSWMFAALLPLVLAVVLAQLSDGGMDAKTVAMLGVLSAVIAAVRPFGAGTGGVETVFFLYVLAGRVFGPGFGFALGSTSMFASALLTGGVGPWLPYQMLGASFFAFGAGLLPRAKGKWEILLLAAYGAVASLLFGLALNLSFWPFFADGSQLSYLPGGGVGENLSRLIAYSVATSLGWDVGRAVTTGLLIAATGPLLLRVFRRAARRADFR
ncbi:ABC transporter permease [Actinorhabdospora filicis]|uniref:ABC transporter permease n=1 Tax=Actinorhabdospora filicis TaxID=1785913 RepID=A0A9W6SJV9_9ACTN|nr:ECF transporter S component [Actinorhabdospora filicis]GLZ76959.1 ABC transporter permease [Actinorhabdospora filicis]